MQLVLLFLTGLQVINTVYSFRDYPANYTASLSPGKLKLDKTCNCTVYEKSFKNVLSRKKRWFVFNKNTLVVLTDVAAKIILSPTPRAIYQSNEVDLFYDVPLMVQGWRQPIDDYIKKMRAQKKQDEEEEEERLKHIGVVNASAIPLDEYYKTSYPTPTWSHQHPLNYQTNTKNVWNPNRRVFQGGYRRPYNRGSSGYYYPNYQRRNNVQSHAQNRNYSYNQYYPSSTDESYRTYQPSSHNTGEQTNNETPTWHHHREYRERRDIYEHIETFGKMLGRSLKKCILRAICEMKQQLLPEGESFINDAARILFTVPTDHDNKDDEFTKMALEENVDCARRFIVSCPHSPLEYFFNNFQPKNYKERKPTTKEIMETIIYA